MELTHSANWILALMRVQGQIADSLTPFQCELRNSVASVGQ
jgi:hypothetical protein